MYICIHVLSVITDRSIFSTRQQKLNLYYILMQFLYLLFNQIFSLNNSLQDTHFTKLINPAKRNLALYNKFKIYMIFKCYGVDV